MESQIIAALAFTGLPCQYGVYEGEAATYLTFNLNSIPADFADDAPQHERWLAQVHLFAPFAADTTALRRQIKAALVAAGFSYPSQIDATAPDDAERHVVFEFDGVEGVSV